jgi:CPA2 family monovalent cation:H+ antiporter-2
MAHTLYLTGALLLLLFIGGMLAHRIRQSLIPAYMIIGFLSRSFIPDSDGLSFLGQLGLIFLLFFIGFEYSLPKILRSGRSLVVAGMIDLVVNFPIGFFIGLVFGWSVFESLILGGILYVSSTAIITKSLIDLKRAAHPETETILGILVFEDLALVIFLAFVSGLSIYGPWSFGPVLLGSLKAMSFFLLFILITRRFVPMLNRLMAVESPELFTLLVFSLIVGASAVAKGIGLTEAIGGFFIGMLIAETIHREKIERAFIPFRDLFSAIFFFYFGLSIQINATLHLGWILSVLIFFSVVGKLASGMLTGWFNGLSRRASMTIGLSMIARGEFSIILAGVAAASMPSATALQAVTGMYVFILAIGGVLMMDHSPRMAVVLQNGMNHLGYLLYRTEKNLDKVE